MAQAETVGQIIRWSIPASTSTEAYQNNILQVDLVPFASTNYPQSSYPLNSHPQHRPHYPSQQHHHIHHMWLSPVQIVFKYNTPTTARTHQSYSWVEIIVKTSQSSKFITGWHHLGLPHPTSIIGFMNMVDIEDPDQQ